MNVLIKIPDKDIPKRQDIIIVDLCFVGGKVRQCTYPFEILTQEPCEVLQEIKREIEGNMESIIGKYDSSVPTRNMPSAKIERNEGREECLAIIDKHLEQYKEDAG